MHACDIKTYLDLLDIHFNQSEPILRRDTFRLISILSGGTISPESDLASAGDRPSYKLSLSFKSIFLQLIEAEPKYIAVTS